MPGMATGSSGDGEAMGLPPKPGEDDSLHPGKRVSDLGSMTKEIWTQKKKKIGLVLQLVT